MVRSKRLAPIHNLTKNDEKEAARALEEALAAKNRESQQLNQLLRYRDEYLQEMDGKVRKGLSATSLRQYHGFLDKLNAAIKQQEVTIKRSEARVVEVQASWVEKKNKNKAMGQMLEKIANTEQKALDKKETAQLDEISTQAFIRRRNQKVSD